MRRRFAATHRSSGPTGISREGFEDCHVYSQQAFAAPEQLGAVGALFQRRCILADAIDTSGDDDAAGIERRRRKLLHRPRSRHLKHRRQCRALLRFRK